MKKTTINFDQDALLEDDISDLEAELDGVRSLQEDHRKTADDLESEADRINVRLMALRVGRHELTRK